jgi:uncharacterized membrane protein SpoIIM required for sporulation
VTSNHWQARNQHKWRQLSQLLDQMGDSPAKKTGSEALYQLVSLYRSSITDLACAKSQKNLSHLIAPLNEIVGKAYTKVMVSPPFSWRTACYFFEVTFPAAVRGNLWFIGLSFCCFILGSIIASVTVAMDPGSETLFLPAQTISQLDRGVLWTSLAQASPAEATRLMTHNIQVTIFAFAYGILFGVGSLWLMIQNGMFAFAGPLQVCFQHGMGQALANFMLAHGGLELSTMFIAGAAGSRLGLALLFPGSRTRWHALREESHQAMILMIGCFVLLVVAGLIEGMVSLNQAVPLWVRLLVSLVTILGLGCYIGFSGRSNHAQKSPSGIKPF